MIMMVMMISKQVMPEHRKRKNFFENNLFLTIKFDINSYPQQCSALRKNGYVMIKSRPCKIMEMSTSKTGKHGHAKV